MYNGRYLCNENSFEGGNREIYEAGYDNEVLLLVRYGNGVRLLYSGT